VTWSCSKAFRRSRSGRYGTAVSAETPESELARHIKEMNPLSAKAICDGRGVAKAATLAGGEGATADALRAELAAVDAMLAIAEPAAMRPDACWRGAAGTTAV
jgi:hypothetical protein